MSSKDECSVPPHTHREFIHKSDLEELVKEGQTARLSRSLRQTGLSHSLRHDHNQCQADSDNFNKTASQLAKVNFAHHQDCLCSSCHCGRHQCRMKIVKPELTKNSVYQRSYFKKGTIPNVVNHDKEYDKLKGDHLDINSIYRNSYIGKNGDQIERPIPEDLLHSNGPAPVLSSYTSQFPGYRGDNQYVKPTDRHTRAPFPLRSKSTYANQFVNRKSSKDDYKYFNDQLKTGYNWFGKTTYGSFFGNPNPEYHAKKVKIIEKKEENPDFNHQYETVYRHEYLPKNNPLCPAKVYLETKGKGKLEDSKHSFAENTDFKALSPEYHAISTSKHWYV